MKKIDYKKLYQKNYKKLPIFVFWATAIVLCCCIITGAVFIILEGLVFLGALVVLISVPVSVVFGSLESWICAVLLSQKIVVADSLIEGLNNSSKDSKASILNEDLPEI